MDSFAYKIETDDFYKDISVNVEKMFKTSNFSKDHSSGMKIGLNKQVISMFKDKASGKIMNDFVGLGAKLYSYKMFESGEEEKKCKGVEKAVIQRCITYDDYKTSLLAWKEQVSSMNIIRSYKHEVFTEKVNKIALSANDNKSFILEDRIHMLAHNHYKVNERKNQHTI